MLVSSYYIANPYSYLTHFSLIGGDPEKVKKSERERFRDDKIVDDIIEIDNHWRKCKCANSYANNNDSEI